MKVLEIHVSEIKTILICTTLQIKKSCFRRTITHVSCMMKSRFKKGLGFNVIGSSE